MAIDDQLPNHIAVVVNSGDNTLSVINLTTMSVSAVLNLPNLNPSPVPYSIGINPLTHRGMVAQQQTNTAYIVDFTDPAGVNGPGAVTAAGGSRILNGESF